MLYLFLILLWLHLKQLKPKYGWNDIWTNLVRKRETADARNHSRMTGHTRCLRSSAGSLRTATPGTAAWTRGTVCQRRRSHPPASPSWSQTPPEICSLMKTEQWHLTEQLEINSTLIIWMQIISIGTNRSYLTIFVRNYAQMNPPAHTWARIVSSLL